MLNAISERRSIRRFQAKPVPVEMINTILQAGMLAPSSKNRQPWQFIVVSGQSKETMLQVMADGLAREKENALLPASRQHLGGAVHTLEIIRQAPVTIWIVNTLGAPFTEPLTFEERVYESCNTQSIGAAIENMSLAAVELGLGSLWIGDLFFAYPELSRWLNCSGTLLAALAVGYPDETPAPRPRKAYADVIQWRN